MESRDFQGFALNRRPSRGYPNVDRQVPAQGLLAHPSGPVCLSKRVRLPDSVCSPSSAELQEGMFFKSAAGPRLVLPMRKVCCCDIAALSSSGKHPDRLPASDRKSGSGRAEQKPANPARARHRANDGSIRPGLNGPASRVSRQLQKPLDRLGPGFGCSAGRRLVASRHAKRDRSLAWRGRGNGLLHQRDLRQPGLKAPGRKRDSGRTGPLRRGAQ